MKYIKRPVVVDAVQYTGENRKEIEEFLPLPLYNEDRSFSIFTLEGVMHCSIGDYVIKGVHGEFYPCKPEIFHKTYSHYNELKNSIPDDWYAKRSEEYSKAVMLNLELSFKELEEVNNLLFSLTKLKQTILSRIPPMGNSASTTGG